MVIYSTKSEIKLFPNEWIFNIDIKDLVEHTMTFLDIINIKYSEEENINQYD